MQIHPFSSAPKEAKKLLGRKRPQWIAIVPDGGPLKGVDHWENVVKVGTLEDGSAVYTGSDPAAWGTRGTRGTR